MIYAKKLELIHAVRMASDLQFTKICPSAQNYEFDCTT